MGPEQGTSAPDHFEHFADESPFAAWTADLREPLKEVLAEMESRVDQVAEVTHEAVGRELPEFRAGRGDSLMGEVTGLVRVNYLLFMKVLREERMPIPEEFAFLASQVATRVGQGLSMQGMLRGYRIGHRVAWDTVLDVCAGRPRSEELIKALSRPSMSFIDVLSAAVSDAYLQATRISEAERDAEAQEFLDAVLAGRNPPDSGFARQATAILNSPQGFLIVRAGFSGRQDLPATSLRRLAATMAQLGSSGGRGAVAIPRRTGVIGMFAVGERGATQVCEDLRRAQPSIEREAGGAVMVGVGLPCGGLGEAERGLAAAESALAMASPERSFVPLPTIPLFEYVTGPVDRTLRQVVDARMAGFKLADAKAGGALSRTVRAYVDADQNSRDAARSLHCHFNTVNYRLRKVRELTGLDPNRLPQLIELFTCLTVLEHDPARVHDPPEPRREAAER